MPTNININNITGATPFNIYLCNSSNTSCIYINTIPSSSLPYNFQVPSVMEGELSYKLKVIDNSSCVFYQDVPIGSCSPSPTPTMTPTPTSATAVPNCAVLYNVGLDVYYYNISTNTSTLLTVPGFPYSSDIAHTLNKLWGIDESGSQFVEYDITLSPFTATFYSNIPYDPEIFYPSFGLASISDTVILAVNDVVPLNQEVVEIDVSGVSPVITPQFPLIVGRYITGDFYKTTTNKFIALNTDYATSKCYVTQWDYSTSTTEPEVDIELLDIGCGVYGLFEDGGNIYITESTSSTKLYSIDKDSPYAITEVCVITPLTIDGASQIPSCLNNNLIPTPTQTPTMTPTPTPTLPQSECVDSGMSGYSFTNVVC
jgi:hypothetical protein